MVSGLVAIIAFTSMYLVETTCGLPVPETMKASAYRLARTEFSHEQITRLAKVYAEDGRRELLGSPKALVEFCRDARGY